MSRKSKRTAPAGNLKHPPRDWWCYTVNLHVVTVEAVGLSVLVAVREVHKNTLVGRIATVESGAHRTFAEAVGLAHLIAFNPWCLDRDEWPGVQDHRHLVKPHGIALPELHPSREPGDDYVYRFSCVVMLGQLVQSSGLASAELLAAFNRIDTIEIADQCFFPSEAELQRPVEMFRELPRSTQRQMLNGWDWIDPGQDDVKRATESLTVVHALRLSVHRGTTYYHIEPCSIDGIVDVEMVVPVGTSLGDAVAGIDRCKSLLLKNWGELVTDPESLRLRERDAA